jgi:hypothetical protein
MNKKTPSIVLLIIVMFSYILIAGKLGDGYKDAKWGMTKGQVKSILSATIESQSSEPNDEGDTSVIFNLGKNKKLKAFFYNNKFYHAEFEPGLGDDDENSVDAIITGLANKYGKGQIVRNMVDGALGLALRVVVWNDGITKITLRMHDPEQYAKQGYDIYPSSTLKVLYESIKIKDDKKKEQEKKQNRDNEEQKQKTLKRVQDDL